MRKSKKTLAILAIVAMVLMLVPVQAFAGTTTATSRLAGTDRIGTALAVAQQGWASGAANVIVAPADDANLVDALAVAPLAGQLKAPILLTYKASLSSRVQTEIATLKATKIYAVGALSSTVISQLKAISGVTVTVLQGADRTNTAADISAQLTNPAGTFVVGYNGLPDALSVASYAAANDYAIVVANPDGTVPSSEKIYGSKTYVLGGPTLVQDISGATRLAGTDRYGTNTQVLTTLSYKYNNVYVANGETLVDALAGSSLAAQTNAPIVLGNTLNNTVAAPAASAIAGNITSSTNVIALGGTGVVPDSMVTLVANGQGSVTPPSNVSIANLNVSGQTVGDGSASAPAVAPINTAVKVSTTVSGTSAANASMLYLVSSSSNITAKDANGNTLTATTLNSPVIIGNDTFNASYTVPSDSQGNVSATFTSTASSTQTFNVVVEAPFSNNGQPVKSNEARMQWGVPGTLVLSPIYTSSAPDSLNFSSSGAPTKGLVAVVATLLPVSGATTPVSGQSVKFTMNTSLPNSATAYFTDANGTTMVAQNASVGNGVGSATYVVTTGSNGQALVYVNANQPSTNGVANMAASITVGVQAQLVNGGGVSGTGYYQWKSVAQATKIANLSPSAMLNTTGITSDTQTVVNSSAETASSGSQLTISGTVEDAAGNPVPNATLAMQDYNVQSGSSNNIQNDAFVQNGTSTLFSATAYPTVTTDSNGNFSFTVTANVPVTQTVYNSITKYYLYYVPATVAIANGQSLPSDNSITSLSFVGNNHSGNYVDVVWQQGQTLQAVGVGTGSLLSQYSDLTKVPTSNVTFSDVQGSDQSIYVGGYNQNAQLIAPTVVGNAGNQFAGYGLDFNISVPSGMYIEKIGNTAINTIAGYTGLAANAVSQADLHYVGDTLYLESVNNGGTTQASPVSDPSAYDGSGQLKFKVAATSGSTSGSINVSVSAYNNVNGDWTDASSLSAQGAASASVAGTFTGSDAIASLGLGGNIGQIAGYYPLQQTNAAPANTITVAGTADDNPSMDNNATFVVAPFNNYVSVATIPTQGLTYSVTGNKSSKLRLIDGYVLQAAPQTAQVSIQANGLVSVNNHSLWTVPSGQNVVGYYTTPITGNITSSLPTTYVLTQGTGSNNTTFTLYNAADTSTVIASWTVPSANLAAGYEGYMGFSIDSSSNLLSLLDSASLGTAGVKLTANNNATALAAVAGQTLTPVQMATVYASDAYAESPTITVTNSVNSQTATATANFTSSSATGGGPTAAATTPASVNFALGGSQTLTITAVDQYGVPLQNATVYVKGIGTQGLWITQVNGTAIQQNVNLGGPGATGTSSNFQTVNAPVPLFTYSGTVPAYNNVYVSGSISAYNLNNGSTPYAALQTGVSGTVSITLQDGNVQYWNNGTPSVLSLDSGNSISSATGSLEFSNTPSFTKTIGSASVNVQ
ncbi:Carboxypeptidase, regulatory domain protein [Acididesulfobacillus acetoxydans]|uniref:Carboxypeptidase, regulatory domain protein n=1 Tax=Acididesulfobacillus acetoxydans TaxID=1561005 RepID=A0A8S0XUP0_9FIRM|nr:cell wall-binding repeat-containing protein [Acididesulfobacillus acetoxydans]CAA7599617.1 Carboxypeptidase, regulatory domain protein [Acididesulfobacillus acetoxydans]CEJ06472.1 Cell wall binding repeat 2-containing protein [Acididesulfobacillus acetoxydans]